LFDSSFHIVAIVGLFGAVLPMVFGMAYLLLPSYVGRTLSTQRLPGVHFILTYAGVGLLLGHELLERENFLLLGGVLLWSTGVVIFIGTLLWTILPAIIANQGMVRPSNLRPQRSTKLAMLAIPIALGYLIVGTIALLSTVDGFPNLIDATFPMVVHFYATGFVSLLIFALGIRLLTGFFHVTLPKSLSWLVLLCGSVAPSALAFKFYHPPWFTIGASLEFIAIMGYAFLVAIVAYRTDRYRVGLYGIGLGALGGLLSVGVALANVIGVTGGPDIAAHVIVVLNGFLLLTIIGYAYQFFPVTSGQFWGATQRTGVVTIFVLGTGTGIQAIDVFKDVSWLQLCGIVLALIGTSGYSYLMLRRLL
jgi:hypothetical protein